MIKSLRTDTVRLAKTNRKVTTKDDCKFHWTPFCELDPCHFSKLSTGCKPGARCAYVDPWGTGLTPGAQIVASCVE